MSGSFITPGHVRAFQLVTGGHPDQIALWSCTINGEAGVAIVMVDAPRPGQVAVMPLFVAITSAMEVIFDGERGSGSGGGGGPTDPREAFEAGKLDVTGPAPA